MAVYTSLDDDALVAWLTRHDVGTLSECRGIPTGIENSNFFVTTVRDAQRRRFVLTLFERLSADELPFYLSLMQHLASRGIPCPAPIGDADGALLLPLAGKPAALVTRLEGEVVTAPEAAHCALIGEVLARLHLAGTEAPMTQPNPRGLGWWIEAGKRVRQFLDDDRRALLDDELEVQAEQWPRTVARLPGGPIHGDLFRDNALFADDGDVRLGGIIDFYFAGTDAWLLDLAICANDWCVDLESGVFDDARLHALLDAYASVRPLSGTEFFALPLALRAAALRFWLSRLDDLYRPRPAQLLTPHDPARFERMLRLRREDAGPRPALPRPMA